MVNMNRQDRVCKCGHTKFWHTNQDILYKDGTLLRRKGCHHRVFFYMGYCDCNKFEPTDTS